MNPEQTPLMNTAEERQEELARGLNNFAEPEQDDNASTTSKKTEETTTPQKKKSGKGRFASMAANMSANTSPAPVQAPVQPQVPPPLPGLAQAVAQPQGPNLGGQTQVVSGRIVGAGAKEPEWTIEQLQHFSSLRSTRLEVITANDSRKTIPDPKGDYVVKNNDGTCSATRNAILPFLSFTEFKIGLGLPKEGDKLPKKKMYSDVVIIGKDNNWVLNQWLAKDVIMEPVPASVRNRSITGRGKASDRTIGVHFARFGFPVESFGPVFHTLDSNIQGLVDSLVVTDGYYWANASWGVTQTPGTFVHLTENGTRAATHNLSEAMDLIGSKSSMGLGTFAISVACAYEKQGDTPVMNTAKYEFSIKCHNFMHFEETDFHGPPQTSAVGMMVGDDLMSLAKPLKKPNAVGAVMNSTGSLFAGGNMNPFAQMSAPMPVNPGEKQGPGGNFLM